MAKTQHERTAKSEAKKKAAGEEELRHKVRPGTKGMLAELMSWHGLTSPTEAVQHMIINAHALGKAASAPLLSPPRHTFEITENVARQFRSQSLAELRRDPGDEIVPPDD